MPPTGYSPQSIARKASKNAEPYYSNDDIAVLHDIVILAQELLPTEPLATNALFSAYYSVLAKFQVNPDHDNRYARILFKIGGLRGPGSLYEKFEEILARMGIQIEFSPEDNEERFIPIEDSNSNLSEPPSGAPPHIGNSEHRGHQRRNSESSAWDVGSLPENDTRKRSSSLSSAPKAKSEKANVYENELHEHSQPVAPTKHEYQKDILDQNIGTWLASGPVAVPTHQDTSGSTHRNLQIRRESIHLADSQPAIGLSVPTSDDYQPASETTAATSRFDDEATRDSIRSPQYFQENVQSENLMNIKASLIFNHHLALFSKSYIRKWKEKSLQFRKDSIGLNLLAAAHDRKALIHSALDTWRFRTLEKAQIAETEHFFTYVERRATRARELYLLHVAFTHWSTCAFEEVQRTALARRHIIRTRIFNAWREITAVNELKVRRHIVSKFFRVWIRRYQVTISEDATAVQKYVGDLVKNCYQAWARKHLAKKALNWWAEQRRRQILFHWIVISHNIWKNQQTSGALRCHRLLETALRAWRTKIAGTSSNNVQATVHYYNNLRGIAWKKWCLETGVIPAKHAVQTDIALRQLREAFSIWLYRTRQEQQASALDRAKIIREAWTNWRHKARSRMINSHVDHRVLARAMYKWIVAGRKIVTGRIRAKIRLQGAIQVWVLSCQASKEFRQDQEAVARASLIRKTQIHALRHWYLSMESLQRLEISAVQLKTSHSSREVLLQWLAQARHLQQLQQWSKDAEFYFAASRNLMKWRSTTESTKREKRRVAYGQVRRITNIRLARLAILSWRQQIQDKLILRTRASEISQNRNVIVGMDIFDRWRGRTEELMELDVIYRDHVVEKHFTTWKNRLLALRALQREAVMTYQERREGRALKKWSLVTLQLRSQANYAADVREKNAKRTFRRMFTYWHQKTLHRRPLVGIPSDLGNTTKAEAWSELGEELRVDDPIKDLDQPILSTPVPGYLSTPSKRSERVIAAAAKYSTTPRAPLSTPFERHLRAQWSGGFPSFRNTGSSKGTLGKVGFADISEVTGDRNGPRR